MNAHNEQHDPACIAAYEQLFQADSRDPSQTERLAVWAMSWNAARAAEPSPVVKQNLTTQPAAAQEALDFYVCDACGHYYMVDGVICDCFGGEKPTCEPRHVRMVPAQPAAAQKAVRKPDGYHYRYPTLYGTGTCIRQNNGEEVNGSKPIEAVPYWYAPVTAAPAEVERAQVNMDAGWYARREEHARSLGYAGVAEALATLERAQSLPADIRSFSQGASSVMDAEDAFEKCADDLEEILRTPAAPGIDLTPFREAVEAEYELERMCETPSRQSRERVAEAKRKRDRLRALIDGQSDASPKGDSEARDSVLAALVEAATAVERADADGELTDDLVDRLRAARDAVQASDARSVPEDWNEAEIVSRASNQMNGDEE